MTLLVVKTLSSDCWVLMCLVSKGVGWCIVSHFHLVVAKNQSFSELHVHMHSFLMKKLHQNTSFLESNHLKKNNKNNDYCYYNK